MAHFMNSEISTPLNNDMYTEYAGFLFRLSTLKLFRFSLLCIIVECQLLLLLLRILLLR